ncbi:MAG UNVERIFIED_CONTAM: hypothetical protein LVR18_04605 [Planctomycetaceae bacterium]
MHPGYQSPNHIGPSGPADTDLTLLGIRNTSGRPLAVLANYAMHYYGSPLVSGDFCGRFASHFAPLIDASEQQGFVGLMSQGTSGDSMWPDYSRPAANTNLDEYTASVAATAAAAWKRIQWQQSVPLAMAESLLTLKRRTPDADRLKKSRNWPHKSVIDSPKAGPKFTHSNKCTSARHPVWNSSCRRCESAIWQSLPYLMRFSGSPASN